MSAKTNTKLFFSHFFKLMNFVIFCHLRCNKWILCELNSYDFPDRFGISHMFCSWSQDMHVAIYVSALFLNYNLPVLANF